MYDKLDELEKKPHYLERFSMIFKIGNMAELAAIQIITSSNLLLKKSTYFFIL